MPDGFNVTKVGSDIRKHHDTLNEARADLADRMGPGTWEITRDGGKTWGPGRSRRDTLDQIVNLMGDADYGDSVATREKDEPGGPKFRIKRVYVSLGSSITHAALSQLGVDYVWADSNPEGSEGGLGAGFDCSGLTLWCYAQAGVYLPHSAEQQRTHPNVVNFKDRARLEDGDLVFYDAGSRLNPGQADHVGIACRNSSGDWWVVDASSGLDRVVFRDIDANPVLEYGYVPGVTHEE